MKEDNMHDELSEISPFLKEQKRKMDPMQVPDGYFEQLESRIFDRLEAEGARVATAPKTALWEVWLSPARLTTVAAALTLVLAAIWWLKPKVEPQMVAAPPAIEIEEDFTPEMAEEYIKANMLDFDTEMLFSNLEEEEQPEQPDNTTKTREKSKKELDNLLNDLTEEELEELL